MSVTSLGGDDQAQALQQMQRWCVIMCPSWMMACLTRVETTGGIGARDRRRCRQRPQVKTGRPVGVLCYVVCVTCAHENVAQLYRDGRGRGRSDVSTDDNTLSRCFKSVNTQTRSQLVFSSSVLSFCLVTGIGIGSPTTTRTAAVVRTVVIVLLLCCCSIPVRTCMRTFVGVISLCHTVPVPHWSTTVGLLLRV